MFSFPNAPSVKYNGYIYATEGDCEFARYELKEGFKKKSDSYKENTKMESYCLDSSAVALLLVRVTSEEPATLLDA